MPKDRMTVAERQDLTDAVAGALKRYPHEHVLDVINGALNDQAPRGRGRQRDEHRVQRAFVRWSAVRMALETNLAASPEEASKKLGRKGNGASALQKAYRAVERVRAKDPVARQTVDALHRKRCRHIAARDRRPMVLAWLEAD